jgi:hypothetical protein
LEALAPVDSLVQKIVALTANLNGEELAQWKLLLGIAAGGLAPHGQAPVDGAGQAALNTVVRCLAKMQPTGIVWRGNTDFINVTIMADIINEARARLSAAERVDRYWLSAARDKAKNLVECQPFKQFLKSNVSGLKPSGLATYIYYKGIGSGLDPHLDADSFTVNFILVLEHQYKKDPSHLVIYGPDSEPERILLKPGEAVILYAGSTIHARQDLKEDERVTLLTIGLTRN